jgi:hypothetical protein
MWKTWFGHLPMPRNASSSKTSEGGGLVEVAGENGTTSGIVESIDDLSTREGSM